MRGQPELKESYILAPVVAHSLHTILLHNSLYLSGERVEGDADSRIAAADGEVSIVCDGDLCRLATDGEGHS